LTFTADFPGAIVIEAAQYGYSAPNHPRAFCLHTPEEPADDNPSTPYYFHDTTNNASTTYFVAYAEKPGPLGPTRIFQCVPESAGAYGNAVEGKPYPVWADPSVNLNLQTLSVEIEGFASNIAQTMPRGSPQWNALVELMAHRCKALSLSPDDTIGHHEVSVYRVDPGSLDIQAVVEDVKLRLIGKEDNPMLRVQVAGTAGQYEGSPYGWVPIQHDRAVVLDSLGVPTKTISQADFDAFQATSAPMPAGGSLSGQTFTATIK